MPKANILVLDPDVAWTQSLSDALMRDNYEVFSANTPADVEILLQAHRTDVLIGEFNLPGSRAEEIIEQFRQLHPEVLLIFCTATPSVTQAVQVVKLGVYDYQEKKAAPITFTMLRDLVTRAVRERQRSTVSPPPPEPLQRGLLATATPGFYGIVSHNSQMKDIFELIQTIADSYANVLIFGETGTGKELVARAIHEASNRHGKPLVTMDCSALARELLESELFGHEKGAFTGASDRHIGRFERANGGTLFLDEVSNIDLAVQAKLLRVLQSRTFERVGGSKSISVDVRIIAATNRGLEEGVTAGSFREDLYHRLNVVEIRLPPLRDRPEDIPLLAMEFLRRFSRQHNKDVRGYTDNAIRLLNAHRWSGNVRELENVVLQAVVLAKQLLIDVSDLPRRITEAVGEVVASPRLAAQLEEPERQIIINAIRQHNGNIKRAAAQLDISRTTLYAKLKKYNVDPDTIR